jgi:hypothetical protein
MAPATAAAVGLRQISNQYLAGIVNDGRLRYHTLDSAGDCNGLNALFLEQGTLDGACGIYVTLMALMLSNGVTRSLAVRSLSRTGAKTAQFRELAGAAYFSGTVDEDLVKLACAFLPEAKPAPLSGSHRVLIDKCVEQMGRGNPVVLSVADRSRYFRHWLLLIGLETQIADQGKRTGQVNAFLLLDPSCACPELALHNARLDLETGRPVAKFLRLRNANGLSKDVTVMQAVVFERRLQPKRVGAV